MFYFPLIERPVPSAYAERGRQSTELYTTVNVYEIADGCRVGARCTDDPVLGIWPERMVVSPIGEPNSARRCATTHLGVSLGPSSGIAPYVGGLPVRATRLTDSASDPYRS